MSIKRCPTCGSVTDVTLDYGPVGDPDSTERFEQAQAGMPAGWHVEGQILGGLMSATRKKPGGYDTVYGSSPKRLIENARAAANAQ